MTFGERLKQLRTDAGMSQEGLSDATSRQVSLGAIRDYEQGKRKPLFAAALALSNALGLDCRSFADCSDMQSAGRGNVKPARGRGKK